MSQQLIINIIIAGSSYTLAGISFYFTFSVARFYHFTHGAFYALGAYLTYTLLKTINLPIILALTISIVTLSIIAIAIDLSIYSRIRKARGGQLLLLLASLGIYTVIQNMISIVYGDSALIFPVKTGMSVISLCGGRITVEQILLVGLAIFVFIFSYLLMKKTRIGFQMNAVGSDQDLSLALGLPVERIIGISFAIGYGVIAIAGVAYASIVDLTPTMGMRPMMMGMVAMIIGGISLWGTLRGAFLLAIAQHLGTIWISTQWQDTVAFCLLIIVLQVRQMNLYKMLGYTR